MKSKFWNNSLIRNTDERGNLSVVQNDNLPFQMKRMFYLTNLKGVRGRHFHKLTEQMIYCVNGKCSLYCYDGLCEMTINMTTESNGFYVPVNHWIELSNFADNCIMLIICSHAFDSNDYYTDKNNININDSTVHNVKLNNLQIHTSQLKNKLLGAIDNILSNGEFTYGEETRNFEQKFSEYLDVKYTISCNNGTSALILALKCLNLPENTEVLIQTNTYVSGLIAIRDNNLQVKWIDIDKNNLMASTTSIEENITSNTKVLLLVHLYGMCCDMDEIMRIKNKYCLCLIEDCCQAHGSTWKNKKLGSFGDISCFSFYPSKNLGAIGEAGCIVTNNEQYYNTIMSLKQFGQKSLYDYVCEGGNYKSSNIIMSSVNVKLDYLDSFNLKRNTIAKLYEKYLSPKITFLKVEENIFCNYHLFVIIVDNRNEMKEYLKNCGIETNIHYPNPLYLTEAYMSLKCEFTNFTELSSKILSLPIYPEMTQEEVIYVSNCINKFIN